MKNWEDTTIGDLAANVPYAIVDGPFGSNLKTSDYVSDGIPVLQGHNITNNKFVWKNIRFISKEKAAQLYRSAAKEGDLLVIKIGSIGYSAIITDLNNFPYAIIPANLIKASFNPNKVLTGYIYYYLISNEGFKKVKNIASNTAQPALSLKKFKSIRLRIPSLQEQGKIFNVMSSIDSTIEKTEALIEKYQKVKEGMMQDLFTRGIGEDGKLRPTHHEAPELYKKTELGMVPKEWDLDIINNLCYQIIDGTHHTPEYKENGVPFLRVTDIQNKKICFDSIKYISESAHEVLCKRCKPEFGDVLYSKNGTVGIPKIVDWEWEFSIFVSLALLKPKNDLINSLFLSNILESFEIWKQIRKRAKQGTVNNLHLEEIREFIIPLPSVSEQNKIIWTINSICNLIEKDKDNLSKLQQLKQALMQDLFTGKVRVSA